MVKPIEAEVSQKAWEAALAVRLRNKHRSWYYRLRRSISFIELLDSNWMGWRHRVGNRVGDHDILWTRALSIATLEELQDLDELRNQMRLGI